MRQPATRLTESEPSGTRGAGLVGSLGFFLSPCLIGSVWLVPSQFLFVSPRRNGKLGVPALSPTLAAEHVYFRIFGPAGQRGEKSPAARPAKSLFAPAEHLVPRSSECLSASPPIHRRCRPKRRIKTVDGLDVHVWSIHSTNLPSRLYRILCHQQLRSNRHQNQHHHTMASPPPGTSPGSTNPASAKMGYEWEEMPDLCGFGQLGHAVLRDQHKILLRNGDTRRAVWVTLPNPDGHEPPDHDPEFNKPLETAARALRGLLDQLPADTVAVDLDAAGGLVSSSTNPALGFTRRSRHTALAAFDLPIPGRPAIPRSQLAEVGRFTGPVDLVSDCSDRGSGSEPGAGRRYVFKNDFPAARSFWTELQLLARLPPHPHLALLDRVVVDEATGEWVVGFTMRHVEGESLEQGPRRPQLKMKWLRQLMATVDDLNLKHGVVHQDIAGRNLIVDRATDSIVLIDFDAAYRVGVEKDPQEGLDSEGRWGVRDDVKGVLVFLYEYITRDPALTQYWLHLVDEKDVRDPAKWVKHPDAELDDDVAEFYVEAMAWARRRRAARQMAHYSEAPEPLQWPAAPASAPDGEPGSCPVLNWYRPPAALVDPARQLLCTGRYADEEEAMAAVAAPPPPTTSPTASVSEVVAPVDRTETPASVPPPVAASLAPPITTSAATDNDGGVRAEPTRGRNLRPRKATTPPPVAARARARAPTSTTRTTTTTSPKRKRPSSRQGTAEEAAAGGTGRVKRTRISPAAKGGDTTKAPPGRRGVAAKA